MTGRVVSVERDDDGTEPGHGTVRGFLGHHRDVTAPCWQCQEAWQAWQTQRDLGGTPPAPTEQEEAPK